MEIFTLETIYTLLKVWGVLILIIPLAVTALLFVAGIAVGSTHSIYRLFTKTKKEQE